jgi:hypothetical protein
MKEETIKEAAKKYVKNFAESVKSAREIGFIDGANYQAERMYSEEDLREAFKGGSKMSWTDISQETQEPYYYDFKEWFEQFKKQ